MGINPYNLYDSPLVLDNEHESAFQTFKCKIKVGYYYEPSKRNTTAVSSYITVILGFWHELRWFIAWISHLLAVGHRPDT